MFNILSLLDFHLVALQAECDSQETHKGFLESVDSCADSCRLTSKMFIFGTGAKCNADGKCRCFCEHSTTGFKCDVQIPNNEFNLYSFRGKVVLLPNNKIRNPTI